jgi:two-component system, sensor histidine kinase and response regulator
MMNDRNPAPGASGPQNADSTSAQLTGGRVLVIDDEPGIREGCRRVLGAQGFQVDVAEDGQSGLRKVQEGGLDLVLLDVMMPGVSGIDLIAPIHAHDPEIVCVVITGYGTVELAVKAIREGAYDFVNKPFSAEDLVLRVKQGVERRRLSLESKRCLLAEQETRRLTEEATHLEEINRAKTSFVRLVTHELRAPIAAIQSYLRLILDGYVPPEREHEIIGRAEIRAQEQLALIADLLELSHLQDGRMPEKASMANLGDILRDVVQQFEGQAREKNQQLHVSISCSLPPVRVMSDQFKSVWVNLISNALKYTPAGGSIGVTLVCHNDYIIGEVKDTGIGIPAEAQEHLFGEFFRAQNAKAFTEQGTGLGLAIVKQVIGRSGGEISFVSEEGKGSTFRFSLPVVDSSSLAGGKMITAP